jgi:AraC family transcriptional regulator of adaptative response / methylphosphotriester-DNA alkyltransferase methyltransferase
MRIPPQYLNRQAEISESFLQVMNQRMDDFMAGRLEEMGHIKDIAGVLCLHPTHVSAIVKAHTGHHPCYFFEQRILREAKTLLADPAATVSSVASRLTYDASNFAKFFKQYEGLTPSDYRRQLLHSPD